MTTIIFDLDNCLASSRAAGEDLLEPAFRAMRAANDGSIPPDTLRRAFDDMWVHAFDWVARKHHFTSAMFDAGWHELARTEVKGRMAGYADLGDLATLRADLFLVTSGFRRMQESKIRALGIRHLFRACHVDAIDEQDRKGKRGWFCEILDVCRCERQDVVVVGDNPDSEIEAGNSLGLHTIQILREGVVRSAKADHHIRHLGELRNYTIRSG